MGFGQGSIHVKFSATQLGSHCVLLSYLLIVRMYTLFDLCHISISIKVLLLYFPKFINSINVKISSFIIPLLSFSFGKFSH